MKNWKTISKTVALDCSKFLKIEYHRVKFDDGHTVTKWPWVITPDFINVVVQRKQGDFLLYHQSKYAIEGDSLAIVGGYIEAGEKPLEAAKRELLEETGYEAPNWTSLGSYVVDANRGCGTCHLFLATDSYCIQDPNADDLETYEIRMLSKAEVIDAMKSRQFKTLTWAAAVALALAHLDIEN